MCEADMPSSSEDVCNRPDAAFKSVVLSVMKRQCPELERSKRQRLEGVRKRLERPPTMHVIDAGQSSMPLRIVMEFNPNAALPVFDRLLAACTPRFMRAAALRHRKVGHQCPIDSSVQSI